MEECCRLHEAFELVLLSAMDNQSFPDTSALQMLLDACSNAPSEPLTAQELSAIAELLAQPTLASFLALVLIDHCIANREGVQASTVRAAQIINFPALASRVVEIVNSSSSITSSSRPPGEDPSNFAMEGGILFVAAEVITALLQTCSWGAPKRLLSAPGAKAVPKALAQCFVITDDDATACAMLRALAQLHVAEQQQQQNSQRQQQQHSQLSVGAGVVRVPGFLAELSLAMAAGEASAAPVLRAVCLGAGKDDGKCMQHLLLWQLFQNCCKWS